MTQMCTYFKTKTDVAQNLIKNIFSNLDPWLLEDLSIGKILSEKKKKKEKEKEEKRRGTWLISEKMEAF